MDLEPDYYYNSLMVHLGYAVPGSHHPGTPIYFLGALLLRVSSDGVSDSQHFFDLAYLVIALLTSASLLSFVWIVLRQGPVGIGLLALVSIFVWPPFLTFMNHFGSESFVVAFGLPTLAAFWYGLGLEAVSRRRSLFISGIGSGLCLATKMSFLPFVAALVAAGLFAGARDARMSQPGARARMISTALGAVRAILPLVLGLVLSFLVFTAPIFARLPNLAYTTFHRPEAYPSGNPVTAFVDVYKHLLEANMSFAIFLLGLLSLFAMIMALVSLRAFHRSPFAIVRPERPPPAFDASTAGILLVALVLGFCYGLISSREVVVGYEPGIGLRNLSPCALFLPFMIVYAWETLRIIPFARHVASRWGSFGCALLALLLLVNGLIVHAAHRDRLIEHQRAAITSVTERLSQLRAPGTRLAFWSSVSNDIIGGEASFHFLGNHLYAFGHFDAVLLQAFPTYTLFDIWYAAYRALDMVVDTEASSTGSISRLGGITYGSIRRSLRKWMQEANPYSRSYSIFTGGQTADGISCTVFPQRELQLVEKTLKSQRTNRENGEAPPSLLDKISKEVGSNEIRGENIAGIDYVFIGGCRDQVATQSSTATSSVPAMR